MDSRIFHRVPLRVHPIAVRGEGVYLFDAAGKRQIDATGGAAVACLGHGNPSVIAAIKRQADALFCVHASFFTTDVAEQLADHLVSRAPPGISHASFVSGSQWDAMDLAVTHPAPTCPATLL